MPARLQVSKTLMALVKAFEGYRAQAARLSDGRWTIGYGHTLTARDGAQVSEADADALLIYDLTATAATIKPLITTTLTHNQFDALCAFAFSVGPASFRDSTVLRLVNAGHLLQAAGAMELWRRTEFEGEDIVVDGLVRRRVAEMALFLTPPGGWLPAPSAVLRPNLDPVSFALAETPTILTVAMDGHEAVARRLDGAITLSEAYVPVSQSSVAESSRLSSFRSATPLADSVVDLPPPSWPVQINAEESAFVLTAPLEIAGEPVLPTKPDSGPAILVPDDVPDLFDLSLATLEPKPSRATPIHSVQPGTADQTTLPVESQPFGLAPAAGLGLLGAVFFGGGLYWSASGGSPGGVFNPWVVGWLACLGGMLFMAVSAYLLLRQLGHIDPDETGFGSARE